MNAEAQIRRHLVTRWSAALVIAAAAAGCSPADDVAGTAGSSGTKASGGSSGSGGGGGSSGSAGSGATGGSATGGGATGGDSSGSGGSAGASAGQGGNAGASASGGSSGSGGASGSAGRDPGTDTDASSPLDAGRPPSDGGNGGGGSTGDGGLPDPSGSDLTGGPTADKAGRMKCTGTSTIHCHADVAVGNYDVSFVLGGAAAGKTIVDAECHRALLPELSTSAGASKRYAFTVNVRDPEGEPDRYLGTAANAAERGTKGLDLYFSGAAPQLDSFGYASAVKPTVVYLAGDSTVTDQFEFPNYSGWGQMLAQHFHLGVSVANYADSGEGSGSFVSKSSLFPAILKVIKSGDYLFIHLGHNDKDTTAATFHNSITTLVNGAKDKGAIPILFTPIARAQFTGNSVDPQHIHQDPSGQTVNLPVLLRSYAKELNVPLIDLTAVTIKWLEQVGPNGWQKYHAMGTDGADKTHTSGPGAAINAQFVVDGLKELNIKPLVDFLR